MYRIPARGGRRYYVREGRPLITVHIGREIRLAVRSDAYSGVCARLILVEIFFRHVVFGKLARPDFLLIGVVRPLDSAHNSGLECISLVDQLTDTLRIRTLDVGQALRIRIASSRPYSSYAGQFRIERLPFRSDLFLGHALHPRSRLGSPFHGWLYLRRLLLRRLFLSSFYDLGFLRGRFFLSFFLGSHTGKFTTTRGQSSKR